MKRLHVYFIHAKTLPERDHVLQNFRATLAKHVFTHVEVASVRVVDQHDPNDIALDKVQGMVDYSPLRDERVALLNQLTKNIHVNQLSNSLKHLEALRMVAECQDENDLHLVLEDDVLYEDGVCAKLEQVIQALTPEHDLVFLGLPSQGHGKSLELKPLQEAFRVLPLNDSYLITKKTAQTLCNAFLPIKFVTNIQLQYLITVHNIRTYFTLPNVFVEGSKFGVFTSTQTGNNMLVFNRDYMTLQSLAQKSAWTAEETKLVEKLCAESPIRSHPDFLYQKAKYLTAKGCFKEAEQCYGEAYNTLIMKNSIVNHDCNLLKDFIRLFVHLQ